MDPPGVEPGSRPRQGDVVPLDHGPSEFSTRVQWTAGESNPGGTPLGSLRRAMPVSSRWTSSPFEERNRPKDRRPIPPIEGPPENRTRSPSLPRRCAAGTPADRLIESRPGRTRTRDSSLGPRYDPPLHHRGVQRKARDSNPHALAGALVSTEARPAVSGYLPFEWTHRESNPDLRHARATSSPWTMGPSISASRVDRRGVEPRSPACDAGVVPLDQQPV